MNLTPGTMAGGHLTKENLTWTPLMPGIEPSPWEYHIIVVVVIFGLVCLLHLAAFFYAICFQNHGHYRPVSAQHSRPVAYEENEIATFYPSITDQDSEAQHVSDDKEECGVQRESMFWGTFIRRA